MKTFLTRARLFAAIALICMACIEPAVSVAQTSGMGSDGNTRVLWRSINQSITLWDVDPRLDIFATAAYGPYPGWSPIAMTAGINNYSYVLWNYANGMAGIWLVDPNLNFVAMTDFGPFPGWTAESLSTGTGSTNIRLLWKRTDGALAIYSLDQYMNFLGGAIYGPYFGWNPAPVGQAVQRQIAAIKNAVAMPALARTRTDAITRATRAMVKHIATTKKVLALPGVR